MCSKSSAPAIFRASPRDLSAAKPRACNAPCRDGEGSGVVAPNPPFVTHQPACKPGSVGHRQLAPTMRDGHSSGIALARDLEQPTRTASLTSLPLALSFSRTACVAVPIRSCSRWGLPCRFRCRSRGALLPHLFTLATPRPCGGGGRFVLCGTVPGVAPAGCYPAPYVDGARTFLPRRLSAMARAAVRPTDGIGMRVRNCRVKPGMAPAAAENKLS